MLLLAKILRYQATETKNRALMSRAVELIRAAWKYSHEPAAALELADMLYHKRKFQSAASLLTRVTEIGCHPHLQAEAAYQLGRMSQVNVTIFALKYFESLLTYNSSIKTNKQYVTIIMLSSLIVIIHVLTTAQRRSPFVLGKCQTLLM